MRRAVVLFASTLIAGDFPRSLEAFRGKTPKLDGVISKGEYSDATTFEGVKDHWISTFSPVTDPKDLALKGYVKHDGKRLFFAFDITDDVLYGIDIPRWVPNENPKTHELTREGFPWFGDEMEILINATNTYTTPEENAAGNGQSWQMVCNLTKSRLGGVGKGGLRKASPGGNSLPGTTIRSGSLRTPWTAPPSRSPAARAISSSGRSTSILAWK